MNIIKPHKNKSREVTKEDIELVYKDSAEMLKLCHQTMGNMRGAFAIHHAQITDNPLNFFVTKQGEIVCNPKIVNHTKTMVDSEEYCYTFFYLTKPAIVKRWNVIQVEYSLLEDNELVHKAERLSGKFAKIFQHELSHGNAEYIYPIDWENIEEKMENPHLIKPKTFEK